MGWCTIIITGCVFPNRKQRRKERVFLFWPQTLTFIFFVLGAAAGSFAANGYLPELLSIDPAAVYAERSFTQLLFSCSKYHLLIVFGATSFIGVALIPATLALRGFALSCTAASVAASFPGNGALPVALILGLPALLTVPSLFVLASLGLDCSSRLLAFAGGRGGGFAPASLRLADCLIPCAACLMAAAAMELMLIPPLIRLIT